MLLNANSLHPFPLADRSVHCVVTSPPYWNLRDYGVAGQLGLEATPAEYVANIVTVFAEVRRVLRDDGTAWLNLGDSYSQDTKWGGASGGKNYTSAAGGIPRERWHSGLKPKDMVGIPWRVAFALQDAGWYLRSDIIWSKLNPLPESITDRPAKSHEYVFLLTKQPRYFYDGFAVREAASGADTTGATNSASFGGATVRPEANAALYTDDGATTCRGWHDLSQFQISVGATMTAEAQRFQVLQNVCLKIGVETPERLYVMNLQVDAAPVASPASVVIPLERLFSLGGPVSAAIPDTAAAPCGAILASHVGADPVAGAFEGAKVVALECALVPGKFFAARLTLQSDQSCATLFVWSSLFAAHVGSFVSESSNYILPQKDDEKAGKTRNRRTVWSIASDPYPGAHFATYPPALVEPCILAGTSAHGVCPVCGAPWVRILEREYIGDLRAGRRHLDGAEGRNVYPGMPADRKAPVTHGWRSSCCCAGGRDVVPAIVLDPFAGSGTTGAVARLHGRRFVGLDLNPTYLRELALPRAEGRSTAASIASLPLFALETL